MRPIRSEEALKRLYTLLACTLMVAVDSVMILYILHYIYNLEFRTQLYFRGHLFVMGMYLLVLLFLGQVFGGIIVGVRKAGEVMFSFLFAAIMSDVFFYFIVTLLSYKVPTPLPLLLTLVLQILFSCLWISMTAGIYRNRFKPYDVLLIYKGESINNFREKYQISFSLSELFTDIFWNCIFHNKIPIFIVPLFIP